MVTVWAVIEVPKGSKNKYELDKDGYLLLDRVTPKPFPANYGSVIGTLSEDGDPLDVFVLTDEPLVAPSKVEVIPLGFLRMIDNGENDYKLLSVAIHDKSKAEFKSLADFDKELLVEIQGFLQEIKDYEGTPVSFAGWGAKSDVDQLLNECIERFKKK